MTICGPKLVDPRLPCQQATGKTSNQSSNLYTPAVAGYVDEAHLMKYIQNERHEVFIDVLVVADMAYLHKFAALCPHLHSKIIPHPDRLQWVRVPQFGTFWAKFAATVAQGRQRGTSWGLSKLHIIFETTSLDITSTYSYMLYNNYQYS